MQALTIHEIQLVSGGLSDSQSAQLITLATQALTACVYTSLYFAITGTVPNTFFQERIVIPFLTVASYGIGSEIGNRAVDYLWAQNAKK